MKAVARRSCDRGRIKQLKHFVKQKPIFVDFVILTVLRADC